MELTDKVIPEVVSVDIGCGVLSAKTNLESIDSHEVIDKEIREAIPFGYNWHNKDSVQYKENIKMIKALLDKYYEVE
jgi:RNA-splicing ligase RtcB